MAGVKQVLARHPVSILSHDDSAVGPELVGANKFAVTWPAEPPPPVQTPLGHAVERSVVLSSSEGESDLSEREFSSSNDKLSQTELSDGYDTSPNHRRRFHQQPVSHTHDGSSDTPRLSRTFSMPLPSQLQHLQNPCRTQGIPLLTTETPTLPDSSYPSRFHDVSAELAECVQMVVQTLLQISPGQILDPAKEQYAACSLSVPTSCMSAVLTTMKNLNFVSANMPDLCVQGEPTTPPSGHDTPLSPSTPRTPITLSDFDVGEMLQGVGDSLNGCAAQIGVDLVLFHADVGLRHVAVRGEEFGLSNTLTYVIRQIMNTARQGDAIDVGLSVRSSSDDSCESPIAENARPRPNGGSLTSSAEDGHILCTFDITHHFRQFETGDDVSTPTNTGHPSARCKPSFESPLLQRLFLRTGASFVCDLPIRENLPGRTCELAFRLERGSSAAISARTTPILEYNSPLLSGARITKEPTLEELMQFSETLRGKKVTLYAKESSSFAHHLTSYLTAWGMDVSHISSESEVDCNQGVSENALSSSNGQGVTAPPYTKSRHWTLTDHPVPQDSSGMPVNGAPRSGPAVAFIFIDDDVSVLRERIQKYRTEQQPPPFAVNSRSKRPSLAAHHRPKSSPQIVRALGYGSSGSQTTSAHVVVHFSSLANYKVVKDIIQTDLALSTDAPFFKPPLDIMVIPKPAGPRRFLTALHTAITKPVVDPFFAPIATSPISPGLHSPPFFNFGQPAPPKSPPSRPTNYPRTSSDRSTKSPRDGSGESHALHPPSPLAMSETAEYFPDSVKLGTSPASGLVISSPDGQPAGIVFQPRAKGAKTPVPTFGSNEPQKPQFLIPTPDRLRGPASRRPSSSEDKNPSQQPLSFAALHSTTVATGTVPRQDPLPSPDVPTATSSIAAKGKVRKPSVLADDAPTPVASPSRKGSPVDARKMASPPGTPNATHPPTNTFSKKQSRRAQDQKPLTPPAMPGRAGKGAADTNIIPPISVLIVDDNPINQTILSTFMRKKKIKYDVAKNGEEAVQKWRSGGFHLILMDIQMPIMDGIEATKEIRHLEDLSAAAYAPSTPQSDGSVRTPSDGASCESRTLPSPYRSSVIIVALTASSLQSDRVAALAAGCNDFLTKPVSLQWLNNKIIEWGSIKALQMWADLRPDVVKTISTEQTAQAQIVARRLHVPEGRPTPVNRSPSRSSSMGKTEGPTGGVPFVVSSNTSPSSEKLDALLKLSDSSTTTTPAIDTKRERGDKHEGATVSSPVIQVLAILDDPDKLASPAECPTEGSSLAPPTPAKEHAGSAAIGAAVSLNDPPSDSAGAHNEAGEIP